MHAHLVSSRSTGILPGAPGEGRPGRRPHRQVRRTLRSREPAAHHGFPERDAGGAPALVANADRRDRELRRRPGRVGQGRTVIARGRRRDRRDAAEPARESRPQPAFRAGPPAALGTTRCGRCCPTRNSSRRCWPSRRGGPPRSRSPSAGSLPSACTHVSPHRTLCWKECWCRRALGSVWSSAPPTATRRSSTPQRATTSTGPNNRTSPSAVATTSAPAPGSRAPP